MERFGIKISRKGYSEFSIPEGARYVSPGSCLIEGDATAATYFAAAAAIAGKVEIYGIPRDSVQGDAAFLHVLERMGAKVTRLEHSVVVEHQGRLKGIDIDMNAMPDAAMTLVPMALYTDGPVAIRNIASWRVKETDRIAAMANEMRKLGVKVECGAVLISIDAAERNAETPVFDTYDDHRMAMCLSLCAFDRDIVVNDPQCVAKTFPGYFKELAAVTKKA